MFNCTKNLLLFKLLLDCKINILNTASVARGPTVAMLALAQSS